MKKVIKLVFIILGIIIFINGLFNAIFFNLAFGAFMEIFIGIIVFSYALWFEKINEFSQKGFLKLLRILMIIGFSVLIIMLVIISFYGNHDTAEYNEDALIVLGGAVKGDVPSKLLTLRLDRAVSYYQKNPNAVIIVTGSKGFQETVTEAYAMEKYLIKKGIPKDCIIKEEKATSTYENFVYSKEILDEKFNGTPNYRVAFVTNNFHVFRSEILAKIVGYDTKHLTTKTDNYLKPANYLRECAAITKLILIRK